MKLRVFVSGCFDLLHSGHVAFLAAAAQWGELTVCIGSDQTILQLKGRLPVCQEEERAFVLRSLRAVDQVVIGSGSGWLDFEPELITARPDVFVVNEDGDRPEKRQLCDTLGIRYIVLSRTPWRELPPRSTLELRREVRLPYRIDLAGGWLDQPFVSQIVAGPVIVASLTLNRDLNERCGMATSTRRAAQRIWGDRLPPGDPLEIAAMLFACENPPGKLPLSGSQDALGIALPGIHRLHYAGGHWPETITSLTEEGTLAWLESKLTLLPTTPRPTEFDVLTETCLTANLVQQLAESAEACWQAIERRDVSALGQAVQASFDAQCRLFPRMWSDVLRPFTEALPATALGLKLAGAGGGGYLLVVSDQPIPGGIPVRIRRHDEL